MNLISSKDGQNDHSARFGSLIIWSHAGIFTGPSWSQLVFRHLLVGNVHDMLFGKVENAYLSRVSENSCREYILKG